MKKIYAFILTISCLMCLASCNKEEYYETANWNCTDEEFQNTYYELYQNKIQELKELYNLEWTEMTKIERVGTYKFYFYDETFTIIISFSSDDTIGYYEIRLFYYGNDDFPLDDYESQRSYVNFINDFTNYAAFDTKTDKNHFEDLYHNYDEDKSYASYDYHYDSIIGNVGYDVFLNNKNYGRYYKMQNNAHLDILANCYTFEGLLKPLY